MPVGCRTYARAPDESEYPSDHSFFCSTKGDAPPYISNVSDTIYEDGSLTIQEMLIRLLEKLAKAAATSKRVAQSGTTSDDDMEGDAEDEDDSDMDGYDIDEDGILGVQSTQTKADRSILQRSALFLFVLAMTHISAAISTRLSGLDITQASSLSESTTLPSPSRYLRSRLQKPSLRVR